MSSFWEKAATAGQGQQRCDVIQGEFRAEKGARKPIRREPPPRPAELSITNDALMLRLAEELDYARRMLQVMGDELASDTPIVIRHPACLQSIDIVGQIIGHIANVVRAEDHEEAVERIGMAELKARLTRRSL